MWSSNGKELKRAERVNGKITANNLVVYTDHYIISQLSTADNNSMYTCEVTVNGTHLISIIGNITLSITGKLNAVC